MTPSLVRASIEELLRWHPGFDLVSIDWQIITARSIEPGDPWEGPQHLGPWVLVELGQPSDTWDRRPAWAILSYAIWKRTGAIHDLVEGAVSDDPIWSPASL